MFGIRFTKRDVVDLNLCIMTGMMMMLSILVRMEIVWKPAIFGASSIIVALAIIEASMPKKRRVAN